MSIGLALLVSADPLTIQQFSLALQNCRFRLISVRKRLARVRFLNRRKFDAVIVDLQLGEQSGLILDEVHLSASNRTAVTFGIGDNDVRRTAAFRKKSQFVFERPLSAQSIHKTLKPAYGLILTRTAALLSLSYLSSRHHPERKQAGNSLQQRKYQRRGHGVEHAGSAGSRRKRPRPVHSAGSRSTSGGGIDDLLVENGPSGSSLRVRSRTSTSPSYRSGCHKSWNRLLPEFVADQFRKVERGSKVTG